MFFYIFPDVGGAFALLAYVPVALGGFGNVPATLAGGVARAREILRSGEALRVLDAFVAETQSANSVRTEP